MFTPKEVAAQTSKGVAAQTPKRGGSSTATAFEVNFFIITVHGALEETSNTYCRANQEWQWRNILFIITK